MTSRAPQLARAAAAGSVLAGGRDTAARRDHFLPGVTAETIGKSALGVRGIAATLAVCGVPLGALLLPLANALVSAVWLQHSNITLKQKDVIVAGGMFLFAAGVAFALARLGRARPLAALAGAFAVVYGGFAATSLPSALGVASGGPLWDAALTRADALLGFDHPALLAALVRHPAAVELLRICYGLTVPMVLLACLVLVLLRRYDRLREINGLFAITVTLVVGASTFFTAAGMLVHNPLEMATLSALPAGAGIYHMPLFEALRSGGPVLYGPFDNPGIVTFPSFHACMALLVGYGLRDDPVLRWPALLYALCTLVSTVPIGGHYVVDVIAGSAIFAACAWLQHLVTVRARLPR